MVLAVTVVPPEQVHFVHMLTLTVLAVSILAGKEALIELHPVKVQVRVA